MVRMISRSRSWERIRRELLTIFCAALLAQVASVIRAQETAPTPGNTAEQPAAKIPPEQLESLVAPIALYPDDLLAQVLVASTYPLEIIQLQQWLEKNPDLKDKALVDAVAKQPWDPSIQSMAAVPDAVKRLADDVQWTTDLGNAFLAQQDDVMAAVQRMRKKAKDKGALESNEQQKVSTEVVEQKTVIVVEPANPEIIYVPSYSPTVVYGAPMYPYPPIYYPPYPPGAAFMSFSMGVMWGAAWGGSCCGCGWGGGGNVNINVNNNFNRINTGGRGGAGGNWQHNPQHRGGAPYGDRATSNKYGGSGRGNSAGNRQASASQQPRGQQGKANKAGGSAGVSNRATGGGSAGVSNRATGGAGTSAKAPGATNRSASSGAASRGGSDHVGSRDIPKSSASNNSALSGGSRGYSGSSAHASSSRGASSMGSRGGGGGRRR